MCCQGGYGRAEGEGEGKGMDRCNLYKLTRHTNTSTTHRTPLDTVHGTSGTSAPDARSNRLSLF